MADEIAPSAAVGSDAAAPTSRDAAPEATGRTLAALSEEERAVLAKVAEIVRKIQFGTVVLVIQDAKVVQIEMAEKFRLR